MAKPAAQALRDLSDTELIDRLAQTKEELFNLRFQHVTGQLENHARLHHVRKDVARLHTELRIREIAAAEALAPERRGAEHAPERREAENANDDEERTR
jgi:large subunit ribosomal protein L29